MSRTRANEHDDASYAAAGAAAAAPNNGGHTKAMQAWAESLLLSDEQLLALRPRVKDLEEQRASYDYWLEQPWRDQCNVARVHLNRYKLSGSGLSGFLRLPDHEFLLEGGLYNRPHIAATICRFLLQRSLKTSIKDRTPEQVGAALSMATA